MKRTSIKRIEEAAIKVAEVAVDEYQQTIHNRLMMRADAMQKALDNEIGKQMWRQSAGLNFELYLRKRSILLSKIFMLHDLDWMIYETFKQSFAE